MCIIQVVQTDLARSRKTIVREGGHTLYRGYTVYEAGGNSQGLILLLAMGVVKGFDLKALGHNSPEYPHILIETLKLAFADRDHYISDPKFCAIPAAALLSEEYAAAPLHMKIIRSR